MSRAVLAPTYKNPISRRWRRPVGVRRSVTVVRDGLAFIPWAPVAQGGLAEAHQALADVARAHNRSVGQVAIAWLLHLSPVMLPIPGTSRRTHLEENMAAAEVELTPEQLELLCAASH